MERSLTAKSAASVFYEEHNDIDIFIEDTAPGYDKIFEEIFSRVFKEKYKISKVFPLGSKTTVLNEHAKLLGNFSRPTIYIVDGDLILISEEPQPAKGLYPLPHYCIENILLDRDSLHRVLNEENPLELKDKLIRTFDYESWSINNIPMLIDLFIDYNICQSTCPELQTVGFEIKNLVSSNSGDLDPAKVQNRKRDIVTAIESVIGPEAYIDKRKEIETRINIYDQTNIRYISAKDYTLPLLLMRLRKITSTKTPSINIKARLAMTCKVQSIMDSITHVGLPT